MTPDELVQHLTADPAHAAVFVDFDGTLAPIVEDPTTSAIDQATRDRLGRLADRFAVVAVVSGRPAAFLADRAAAPGVRLLGLYGLEEARDGTVTPRPELEAWQPAVEQAKFQLAAELDGRDGLWIEDKGGTVAVHWRRAPDREAAAMTAHVAITGVAQATGLAVEPGKMVAELRPPVDWDKGHAVDAVCEDAGVTAAAYIGDDLGDLVAFDAVHRRGGIAVAVDQGAETPDAVRAAADVVVQGTDGVRALLEQLDASH